VPDAIGKIGTFFVFGLGFGLPLVLLSLVTGMRSREVVRWIVAHHRAIEVLAGFLLIVVAILDLADKWSSIRVVFGI
jgi:cytochrome c biogenesis protein CcdA